MSEDESEERVAETVSMLTRTAIGLWGPERAAVLLSVIEETARRIGQVSQHPLPFDDDPGFRP